MPDIFFYGTLRHRPLLEVVLGPVSADRLVVATLPDAEVSWVESQIYPMIRLDRPGARAEGLVLRDVSDAERARLDFYEGGFDYALEDVDTEAGPAQVYLPGPGTGPPGLPWKLGEWAGRWGDLTVEAAREVMALFGTKSATEVAGMFHAIRMRAAARLRGRARAPDPLVLAGSVKTAQDHVPYADFFAMRAFDLRHDLFGGGQSAPLKRAVLLGMDAALVLPYDPVRDRVLLVEQVRMGPIARSDPGPWQLEPIAGHVDPGETPEEAAHREAWEEAGLRLSALHPLAEVYASPGNSTEFFYIYLGLADLAETGGYHGGVEAEGENIRTHVLSFAALMDLVRERRAANSPLVICALWLAHIRDRLRAEAQGGRVEVAPRGG